MKDFIKNIIYFLPAILGLCLYIFIGILADFSSIGVGVWFALLSLIISGILMKNNRSWGAVLGIIVGAILIYMGNQETGQIFKETPFGIVMCIYYIICGIISYKK